LKSFAAFGLMLSLAVAPAGPQLAASPVPGPPSALALSRDGKTLFVGIDREQNPALHLGQAPPPGFEVFDGGFQLYRSVLRSIVWADHFGISCQTDVLSQKSVNEVFTGGNGFHYPVRLAGPVLKRHGQVYPGHRFRHGAVAGPPDKPGDDAFIVGCRSGVLA